MKTLFLRDIKDEIKNVLRSGIGQAIFPALDSTGQPRVGPYLYDLFSDYINKNKSISSEVFLAKVALLTEVFNGLNDNLETLSDSGIRVNIRGHLRVTRALLQNAPVYMQLQTNCALEPDIWTVEWKQFVDEISKQNIIKKYILVGSQNDFSKYRKQMLKVASYLRARNFYVGFCDTKHLSDALGEGHLVNNVVEFFGGDVIKTVSPYEGVYSGGKEANMIITTQETDPKRHKYLSLVDRYEIGFQ